MMFIDTEKSVDRKQAHQLSQQTGQPAQSMSINQVYPTALLSALSNAAVLQ